MIQHCLVVSDDGNNRYGLLDAAHPTQDGDWPAYTWSAGDGENPRPVPGIPAMLRSLAEERHHPAGSGRPSS